MSARTRGAPSADQGPPASCSTPTCLLSALVFGRGGTVRLRVAWQDGHFLPLVSTATAQELVRILGYPKFCLDAHQQQELLADSLPCAEVVRTPQPPPVALPRA